MVTFIDDSTVDEWFEEETKRISKIMRRELEKGVEFEKASEKFNKAFNRMIADLPAKYEAVERYQERQRKLHEPMRRWEVWKKKKGIQWKLWVKTKKEEYKKWKFEREYRKLFHLKKKEDNF